MTRHHVAALDDLVPGSLGQVEVAGVLVCLVRLEDGAVYAIGDECSHEDIELSDGELDGFDVECPAHGSCFDVRTGMPDCLPATAPVPTYPVHVDAGEVYIEIGD